MANAENIELNDVGEPQDFVAGDQRRGSTLKDKALGIGESLGIKHLNMREGMRNQYYLRLLNGILAFGEFVLLLLVLLVLLEIGPQDIPSACPAGVLQKCLTHYGEAGGDAEPDFLSQTCGKATVDCWRGSVKTLLYQEYGSDYEDPPPKTPLNGSEFKNLSTVTRQMYGPQLVWCHCLLTRGYENDMPDTPFVWRIDLDYFCESLNDINRGWGFGGIFIGVMVLCVRSYISSFGDVAHYYLEFQSYMWFLVLFLGWLVWSCVMIWTSTTHSALHGAKDTEDPCELPDSQLFFYVFYISIISFFGSIGALVCVAIILWGRVELNRGRDESDPGKIVWGVLRWMGDDQQQYRDIQEDEYWEKSHERLANLRKRRSIAPQVQVDQQGRPGDGLY